MESGTKDRLWDLGQKALLAGATYFIVVRPVLKKLGILSDVPPVDAIINSEIWKKIFNPAWWKENETKVSLKWRQNAIVVAGQAAMLIKTAKNQITPATPVPDDNEEQVYKVFNASKSKFFVSMTSAAFKAVYKEQLSNYLVSFLSDEELNNIKQIVEKLPDFPAKK